MAKVNNVLDSKPPWKHCIYCTDIEFKRQHDFVR